jgi:hypothetical protein
MPLGRPLALASRLFWACALALVTLLVAPSRALAWFEVHVAGDEVRVTLNPDGPARVEHRIRLHISGGPVASFDLRGIDRDAEPEPDGYVVPAHDATSGTLENAVPITTELLTLEKAREDAPPPPLVMRIRFDKKRGLPHGAYVLFVRYKTDLAKRGLVKLDGASAHVRWDGPIFEDGFDNARVTFDLPVAPTEPRSEVLARDDADDAPTNPPMFLSNLRRGVERDELELLRPYAAKSESIAWAMRADVRALRKRGDAQPKDAVKPPDAPALVERLGSLRPPLFLALIGGLFVLYSILVALKSREIAHKAREAGATARPLVPIPLALRAVAAGICLAAGVALELVLRTGTTGAALVVLAVALAAHRTPRWSRPRRGPGRWLPISEAEAFRTPPRRRALLDASTHEGKALFLLAIAGAGVGVFVLSEISQYHAWLVGFDFVAVLVLFGTGMTRELPPDPAIAPAPLLATIARLIKKSAGDHIRIVPRLRVPLASPDADELRIAVAPRAPLAGFMGIEVGVVYVPGAGGAIAMPELLLRVAAGSDCERALEPLARRARSLRGRRPEERVFGFSPRLPTAKMTAAIAVALAAKAARRPDAAPVAADKRAKTSKPQPKRAA